MPNTFLLYYFFFFPLCSLDLFVDPMTNRNWVKSILIKIVLNAINLSLMLTVNVCTVNSFY